MGEDGSLRPDQTTKQDPVYKKHPIRVEDTVNSGVSVVLVNLHLACFLCNKMVLKSSTCFFRRVADQMSVIK